MRPLLLVTVALCSLAALGRAETPLELGFRQMYNLQFTEAHNTFGEWQRLHPEDPLGPACDAAAYLFSEFDRLHILQSEFFTHDQHFITDHKLTPDPEVKRKFEAALASSRRLAGPAPSNENAMFALVLANGLHSDYLALIEKRYGASFQKMKAARQQSERLLALNPQYYDAWVAIGVENYMLSIKAAPIRFLLWLAGGEADRAGGIQKFTLAAEKGHYLAPFARLLLAVAALRENDKDRGRGILQDLARQYPQNRLYAQELLRLGPATAKNLGGAAR
jgi:hypothetical protein